MTFSSLGVRMKKLLWCNHDALIRPWTQVFTNLFLIFILKGKFLFKTISWNSSWHIFHWLWQRIFMLFCWETLTGNIQLSPLLFGLFVKCSCSSFHSSLLVGRMYYSYYTKFSHYFVTVRDWNVYGQSSAICTSIGWFAEDEPCNSPGAEGASTRDWPWQINICLVRRWVLK